MLEAQSILYKRNVLILKTRCMKMTEFKEALEHIDFCLSKIKSPIWVPKENAIWSSGTALNPRITEETLICARDALLIADKLMQEPSDGMIIAVEKNEEDWLRLSESDVFKAMRDQMLREI